MLLHDGLRCRCGQLGLESTNRHLPCESGSAGGRRPDDLHSRVRLASLSKPCSSREGESTVQRPARRGLLTSCPGQGLAIIIHVPAYNVSVSREKVGKGEEEPTVAMDGTHQATASR